jgi:hypothetical protein
MITSMREFIGRNAKRSSLLTLVAFSTVCTAATSPIGRPLKFYETNAAKSISFKLSPEGCPPASVGPCVLLDQWGNGKFNDVDLGVVNVSGSSGRSTICLDEIGKAVYVMKGASLEGDIASFSVRHRYELRSAVLDNLSLIDPLTGVALNGKINIYSNRGFLDQDYIKIGQRMGRNHTVSSFECGTPLMSYSTLTTAYGLSSLTAQYLMSQPMTIRLYVTGELMQVEGGFYTIQMRTMGD